MLRVFVSYSQDNPEHGARVLALTQQLRGDGVDAIVDAFVQEIYEADARNDKFIPVLLDGVDDDAIPTVLRAWTWYRLPGGYEDLLRRLFGKPKVSPAPLGPAKKFD